MAGLESGKVIAGKYRLLHPISEGGMGAIWRAHHTQLEAPVAIKLVHASLLDKEGTLARFEREAKASARIRSPYVVHINDHGIDEESGMPFIVMELLEGEDLQRRLRRVGRLAPDHALSILEKVCKGLARAHELGIVHRDLKPANVFLCDPDDETVKILDFGIAKEIGADKIVGGDTTTPGQVLGTPHYMSPEQARGQLLTPASDVWSLSVIAYRTLVGQRPFHAHEYGDLVVKICSDPVTKPSALNPDLGPAIDAFFERAFDRTSGRRFGSADAFLTAFERATLDATVPRSSMTPPAPGAGGGLVAERADAAARRVVRAPQGGEPEESSKRGVVLGVGVIIAGAIVLVVARRPGDFDMGAIIPAFEDAAKELDEAIHGKPVPSGVLPSEATPEQKEAAAARARDDAWMTLYQQVQTNDVPLAVATLEGILEEHGWEPARRPTVVALAGKALGRPDRTHDRMVALLRQKMGPHGPDVLFELVVTQGDTRAGQVAAEMLDDAELRAKGSADLKLAHRLRGAARCAKKGLLIAGKADVGPSTLRQIEADMAACSPKQPCCMRGDASVKAIVEDVRARESAVDEPPDAGAPDAATE